MHVRHTLRTATGVLLVSAAMGCDDANRMIEPLASANNSSSATAGQFKFTPLPSSAVCGPTTEQPFVLPAGYTQTVFAREGDGGTLDLWDMATQNETGPEAGRFIYRAHEIGSNGQVSVTDLETNVTRVLAQRQDWERLDGIAWTPWGTILTAEETTNSALKDPTLPAARVGATGYGRPEDVEIFTSTGNGGGQTLYVAITSENRVLGVDLREPAGGREHGTALVYNFVRAGVNAPMDFVSPDNLALDKAGNLYITEDPSSNPVGADIWMATPGNGGQHQATGSTVRFASLPDCAAEPSGIYFDKRGWGLFVHVQHRGGPDPRDLAVKIERVE